MTVEGHTDNVGADAYNAKLSQARAASVRAFLLSRPELRGRTIVATGFVRHTGPVASNTTEEGRQQNRESGDCRQPETVTTIGSFDGRIGRCGSRTIGSSRPSESSGLLGSYRSKCIE